MDKNILNYIFTTLLNFNNESNTKKIIKLSSKKKDIIEGFQTDDEDEEPKNDEPKNEDEESKNDEDAPKKIKKKKAGEDKPEKTEKPKKVKKGRKKLCLGKTCMDETDLKKILESIQDK